MQRVSPLAPHNLNTEETMADSVTEQVPITPASEDQRSEVDDTSASSETLTSFNTNVSMGENGEPTLKHVLEKVCNLTTFPGLDDYLKTMGLTGPEGFAIAEQEDFHGLVPDLGRVAVRKLMILSNYCKVNDSLPPMGSSITQVKKHLIATDNWEESRPIPQSPIISTGDSSCSSEESQSSKSSNVKETLVLKEAGVTILKLKEFTGDPLTWADWYTAARGTLGNNRWLHVAEKPLDQPLTTEAERQISTSLFWQLRKACDDGSRSSVITDLDPPEGAQYAQGREAWQSLIEKVNTKLQLDCQASGWNRKLIDCVLTRNSSTTMAQHVNDFNSYVSKLKKLKRLDHSERSLFTLFTESILDSEYNNTIKDGIKKGMTLEALQVELCADEQMNTDRSEKLRILKAQRAVKEALVETKRALYPVQGRKEEKEILPLKSP